MDNNRNRRENRNEGENIESRAHRRPENIYNNSGSQTRQPRTEQQQQRQQTRQADNDRQYTYVPADGGRRQTSSMTVKRDVSSVSIPEDRKLERKINREIKESRKEESWQQDIVRVKGSPDLLLLVVCIILLALGAVTIYSAGYPVAISDGYDGFYHLRKHLMWIGVGMVPLLAAYIMKPEFYKKWAPIALYALGAVLLVIAFIKGTSSEDSTSRWLILFGGKISVQPSEIMKAAVPMMIGWYVDKNPSDFYDQEHTKLQKFLITLKPVLIVLVACGLIILGKHLSGTIIVAIIGIATLIVAGYKIRWLIPAILPISVIAGLIYFLTHQYAWSRVTTFFSGSASSMDEKYQTMQSVYAIGSGGLLGKGIGQSQVKYGFLPKAHTDFIFSVWCEELGFVGAVAVVILFMVLVWRGYRIAMRAPDKFMSLTAFGITTHIGLQAFLNMFVATDLIANTGIPLPFFTYGGSSMVILMGEIGILLGISRRSYRKKADIEREELMRKAKMEL